MTENNNSKDKEPKLDLTQMPIDKEFIDGLMQHIQNYGDMDKKSKNNFNF